MRGHEWGGGEERTGEVGQKRKGSSCGTKTGRRAADQIIIKIRGFCTNPYFAGQSKFGVRQ